MRFTITGELRMRIWMTDDGDIILPQKELDRLREEEGVETYDDLVRMYELERRGGRQG